MTTDDADVVRAAELSSELRAWLRPRGSVQVQATALVYELAALIAREADSYPMADSLVYQWSRVMKEQIHRLGVGLEHP